jgi:Family of unknown function (DUF6367)
MKNIQSLSEHNANTEFADSVGYMIVEVNESVLIQSIGPLHESEWRRDTVSGFLYRVDPPRPQWKGLRHVHIADKRHLNAKNKQVAWNDDGTRHDRSTFDLNFRGMEAAKGVARRVLKLPDDVILEGKKTSEQLLLLESMAASAKAALVLIAVSDT